MGRKMIDTDILIVFGPLALAGYTHNPWYLALYILIVAVPMTIRDMEI